MTEEDTVKKNLEELGIEPKHFETLYELLKKEQKLPSGDAVPWKQYTAIVDYLRDECVLDEDNKVQPDGLKVFDSRRELEGILNKSMNRANSRPMGSSGGFVPCRRYRMSSGGTAPCRY